MTPLAAGLVVLTCAVPLRPLPTDTLPLPVPPETMDQLLEENGGIELMDDLSWRREHPTDLNKITLNELLSLPSVTAADAAAVLRFRREHGRFVSVGQLGTMVGGGTHAVNSIGPYVTVIPADLQALSSNHIALRSRLIRGASPGPALQGGLARVYTRVTFQALPGLDGGALFDRDAGERTRDALVSGYAAVRGLWSCVDIIVGDYAIESAQGLVLWRGRGMSKSAWTVTGPRKAALGIVPNRSTDETRFLRGIALGATMSTGRSRFNAIGFASRRSLPATVDANGTVTSFAASTAFTTASLAAKKNAVSLAVAGGRFEYIRSETIAAGATYYHARFDRPVDAGDPFHPMDVPSDVLGIDWRISGGAVFLFGELAAGRNAGSGLVTGGAFEASEHCSAMLVYREYSPNFRNMFASGFGDNGDTRNEQGLYVGTAMRLAPWATVRVYYDQFRHPMPGTTVPFPVTGNELLVDAEAVVNRHFQFTARYSLRTAEEVVAGRDQRGRDVREADECVQYRWKLEGRVRWGTRIELKTCIDFTRRSPNRDRYENGILVSQELRVRPHPSFMVGVRLIFFGTDSYASRLYDFEQDLPGVFSSHALFRNGRRWYLIAQGQPAYWYSICVKYASSETERDVLGDSTFFEIPARTESSFSVQIDVRL